MRDDKPTRANSEQLAPLVPVPRGVSLIAVLVLFLVAAFAVNPFREAPVEDDWAYAETVRHFLETGQYRLNGWLSANIAFQTAWGALFCLPAGYSFSALRVSTIVLALIGLAAFRELAIEQRIGRNTANLLTLCIATSPLFFKMSLTFMSDVPFVAVTTMALLFYGRALRRMTWPAWIAASLAGAASILTRQFGVALLAALAVVWLADVRRFERLSRYAVGAALPLLASVWQVDRGWNHSNWAAAHNLNRQRIFLWGIGFLKNVPWRPLVIVEYLAWFLMPLALVAGIAVVGNLRKNGKATSPGTSGSVGRLSVGLLGWTGLFVGGVFYGREVVGSPALMPFLSWNFEILYLLGTNIRILATVITIAGAVCIAYFVMRRYLVASERPKGLHEWFLDTTTVFSLLLALVFFLIGDEYLLIFLPFATIAVGRQVEPVLMGWRRTVLIVCLALLIGAAVWTREGICRNQAIWTLAERVHATGVPTDEIFAGWEWAGYYHFDDYARMAPPTATTTFADFFDRWMAERRARAQFLIVHDPHPPAGQRWKTVDRYQYFSVFSRGTETFYTVRRQQAADSRPVESSARTISK
jgi:4-amino-4-deoxy-L-arabinose transferase-like glycosyltransferase